MTGADASKNLAEESLPHKPCYAIFFRFVREHCCNYSAKGPNGKRHYCWLEPPQTNSLCVIPYGVSCNWFVNAVLPLEKALQMEWERINRLEADPDALPWIKQERTCPCGTKFVPRSHRHLYCGDCSRARRREQLRQAVRKHRRRWAGL